MHPKDAEGIANSVDPDQTAPLGAVQSSDCSSRSSPIWVCTVCPGLSVRKLRKITVVLTKSDFKNKHIRASPCEKSTCHMGKQQRLRQACTVCFLLRQYMSRTMRKPVYAICEQQRRRSAPLLFTAWIV